MNGGEQSSPQACIDDRKDFVASGSDGHMSVVM